MCVNVNYYWLTESAGFTVSPAATEPNRDISFAFSFSHFSYLTNAFNVYFGQTFVLAVVMGML